MLIEPVKFPPPLRIDPGSRICTVTVSSAVPLIELDVAVTTALPTPTPVANPKPLIVAYPVLLLVHVTVAVHDVCELSDQ